jgi:hypothetical protein
MFWLYFLDQYILDKINDYVSHNDKLDHKAKIEETFEQLNNLTYVIINHQILHWIHIFDKSKKYINIFRRLLMCDCMCCKRRSRNAFSGELIYKCVSCDRLIHQVVHINPYNKYYDVGIQQCIDCKKIICYKCYGKRNDWGQPSCTKCGLLN